MLPWMRLVSLVIRLILAFVLMVYGVDKIRQGQFSLPSVAYATTLGDLAPRVLAWAFLAQSDWLQTLLGLLEFVPAVMLLFRRTWRAGAVFLLPVLTGVVLINFAYALWPATQLISSALLAMDIAILAMEWRRWATVIPLLTGESDARKDSRVEAAAGPLVLLCTLAVIAAMLIKMNARMSPIADFTGNPQVRGRGAFVVEWVKTSGQPVTIPQTWFHFNYEGNVWIQADGRTSKGKFQADRSQRTVSIVGLDWTGSSSPIRGTYEAGDGGAITIRAVRDGVPVEWRMRPRWPGR